MDGHARPKCGDFLRKVVAGFGSESRDPFLENVARGVVQSLRIVVREFLCQGEWRKTSTVEDLIGIRVADTAE